MKEDRLVREQAEWWPTEILDWNYQLSNWAQKRT